MHWKNKYHYGNGISNWNSQWNVNSSKHSFQLILFENACHFKIIIYLSFPLKKKKMKIYKYWVYDQETGIFSRTPFCYICIMCYPYAFKICIEIAPSLGYSKMESMILVLLPNLRIWIYFRFQLLFSCWSFIKKIRFLNHTPNISQSMKSHLCTGWNVNLFNSKIFI